MSEPIIIYENSEFIAVDKPSGWLTIPGRTEKKSSPVLRDWLQKIMGGKVMTIHRLDEVVSGLVLFARSQHSHRTASQWFESRAVHKMYQSMTPAMDFKKGQAFVWKCKILRGKKRAYESPGGKDSVTEAGVVGIKSENGQSFALWEVFPKTGRGHQIRYELYRHSAPILGDTLYGSQYVSEDGSFAIALRALQLDFSACAAARDLGLPEKISVPLSSFKYQLLQPK